MNEDIIKGKWHEIKGRLKQQWAKVTDDEIAQMKGSFEELQGVIQQKYGYQKEQAHKEIQDFIDKHKWNK